MKHLATIALFTLLSAASYAQAKQTVAILGALPPATSALKADLAKAALSSTYTVSIISPEELADPTRFSPSRYNVLVLPHSGTFPAVAQKNLLAYLQHKGRLLCLDGPPFTNYVYRAGDAWVSRQSLLETLPASGVLLDIGKADLKTWSHASNDPAIKSDVAMVDSDHGPAFHFTFADFTGWDNHAPSGFASSPYPAGNDMFVFWAKGDAKTDALVVEWKEKDGSRWITPVSLTTKWKRYALAPEDFRYWPDSSAPNRGGAGDRFRPENAWVLSLGLAQSHANLPPGPKQFWIAGISAGKMDQNGPRVEAPILEGLSPWHKIHTAKPEGYLPISRYLGGTYMPGPGRLTQYTGANAITGWEYTALSGPMAGAVWGASRQPADRIGPDVARILRGWRAVSGGPISAYMPTTNLADFRATLINAGDSPVALSSEFRITGSTAVTKTLTLATGAPTEWVIKPTSLLKPGFYTYRWTFTDKVTGHKDALDGAFTVGTANTTATHVVTTRNGDFQLDGKPWRPVGVNYWPLWVSGQDEPQYWEHWLSPNVYDPTLIEADLVRAEKLGINALSVLYGKVDQAGMVQDFLARCQNHHIHANVFLSYGNPLANDLPKLKELIATANLQRNDAVYAYDIAWEPRVGGFAERRRFGPEWEHWVQVNYGSVQKAERDWGVPIPTDNGVVTCPTDAMISKDGPWRKMVAAYRRFMDDRISWGYREVRAAIRSVDANHLVGVRSGYGGNGNPGCDPVFPFDLASGVKHLDFVSPEGYALNGDWKAFLGGGGYTTAYARWAGNGKPVFWAEGGQSVYPNTTPARIVDQGKYIENTLRMVEATGACGAAAWWWPGGLRLDENSDYGVMNPDGTARPAAVTLGAYAKRFAGKSSTLTGAPHVITIDRDLDARGYSTLWTAGRDGYAAARAKGLAPVIRTAGTGTTTANVPLIAIGNDPADGANPLKYVNAELNSVRMRQIAGKTVLSATVGNTGEAAWANAGTGRVALIVRIGEKMVQTVGLTKPVARFADYAFPPIEMGAPDGQPVTLRMAIIGRTPDVIEFGEQTVIPAK